MGSTKKEDRIDVNGRAFQLMRKRARAQGRKVTSSKPGLGEEQVTTVKAEPNGMSTSLSIGN